ncbi:hypothetical protein L1987_12492 [Smallanthus sonchifolius]|uniref:Uncharacterized protein n=1 Tax=Smallanthus sonchifolius TaxID=185202 RepID=A0ACB9JEA6_9ASTR|nr:hypothetical protein L1987_12492 [Smallanthus sonchifolius]
MSTMSLISHYTLTKLLVILPHSSIRTRSNASAKIEPFDQMIKHQSINKHSISHDSIEINTITISIKSSFSRIINFTKTTINIEFDDFTIFSHQNI